MTTDDGAPPHPSDDLDSIAALAAPNRRALYEFVTSRRDWVSRDQAADAVGLRRGIAAHHLDRLVADGLLETDYRHLSGRRGPGSGRPAKVYRRSSAEFGVSLPPRNYELAARLLAEAADRARLEGTPVVEAIERAVRDEARRIADATRNALGRRAGRKVRRAGVFDQLRDRGFEPEVRADGVTVLHNCPFHQLAAAHTDLICAMNHRLLDALLRDVENTDLEARLEPEDGYCCVRLHPVDAVEASAPKQLTIRSGGASR